MRRHFQKKRASSVRPAEVPAIPNPRLWYDGADASTVILNGSRVAQWLDKSVNNDHLTQATASKQPLYVPAAFNGKNGILFSRGRRDVLSAVTGSINQPHTIYLVASESGGSGARFAMASTAFIWRTYMLSNKLRMDTGGIPLPTGATAIGSGLRLHTTIYNGASSALFLERAVNILTGNKLGPALSTGLDVGDDASTGSNLAWNGYINEIRFYLGAHNTAQRAASWDQMLPKWGLE